MHVGISTGFANHTPIDDMRFLRKEMTQLLYAAELGFESIWITEHHFSNYSVVPSPVQMLTWIGAQNKKVRLGTQVIVVPWHDPVRLAEDIATLDNLSGGRMILGFGRGLARMEYEGLRVDQNKARELFDEIVPMVMRAMETGYLEGGEIFKQPRRELRPRPVRSLKGRAFVAAGSPSSMVSAAKIGLGQLYLGQPMVGGGERRVTAQDPLDTAGTKAKAGPSATDAWLEAWNQYHPGETPPPPFASSMLFIDESSDRAKELAREYVVKTMRAMAKNYELTSKHHGTIKGYERYGELVMTDEGVEKMVQGAAANALAGNPQEVLTKLDEVRRSREPQGMIPHLYTGGLPHEDCMNSIRVFAKHCLNEMKSWKSAPWTVDGDFARAAE